MLLPLAGALVIMWLVLSQGYERMQKAMTLMMVAMAGCFFVIALRGFSEITQIVAGFVPDIPPDLPIPGTGQSRQSTTSIISIVGSAIAPAALLGMSYLSSDSRADESTLRRDFRKSILNLGIIFGAYAMFILIAGGYALFPLENHAQIDAVHEASRVLVRAFPESLEFAGPAIFAAGVLIASVTTIVLAAQLSTYFCLDMIGRPWRFSADNRAYRTVLVMFLVVPAVLAPFWDFPALLKVVLLMGVNVLVIPLVIIIVIYMVNRQSIVGDHRSEWWRTSILVIGLIVSFILAANKLPDYIQLLSS